MQKRFVWRRIFAASIDYLIVVFLTSLIMMALAVFAGPDKLRMGLNAFTMSSCGEGQAISQEMAEFLGQDTVVSVKYCQEHQFFFDNGYTANIVLEQSREGRVTTSRGATMPVDDQGRPVAPFSADMLIALALAFVTATWWMSITGGKTWGKALLRLRVTPAESARLRKREALRLAPLAILAVLGYAASPLLYSGAGFQKLTQSSATQFVLTAAAPALAIILFLGWAYVLPLVRGERRARYDIAAGTNIERA